MNIKELAEKLGHRDKYLIKRYIEEGSLIVTKSTGWRQFEFAEGFDAEKCIKHHEECVFNHRSESMKAVWQKESYRERIAKSQSEHSKKMWQNEEYRNKVISSVSDAWTDERRKRHGKEIRERFKDEAVKEKLKTASNANWSKPERREKQSKAMKAYYANPENREKSSKAVKAAMTDKLKAKISERTKEGQKASNAYAKISAASVRMWKDPNHSNKVHKGMKRNGSYGYSYDHKRSIEWLKSKGLTIEQEKQYPTEPSLHCDAYIKEFDKWIEFHYYWGHQNEPFDSSSLSHIEIVEDWKKRSKENKEKYGIQHTKFDACIKSWTIDDVRRKADAEKNGLNWTALYDYAEFQQYFNRLAYGSVILYPWDDYLKAISFNVNRIKISGHNCIVKEVDSTASKGFLDSYHYQGSLRTVSDVRIGLFYNNELISLATFGRPRYNKNYEWEALRYCTKAGYAVLGGTVKLYTYFEDAYKPKSIVSYQDLSKFTGDFHEKLGYSKIAESKSRHWYNYDTKIHLTDNLVRQRGVDNLLGTTFGKPEECGMTNEQILRKLGYHEIYDEGQRTYAKVF